MRLPKPKFLLQSNTIGKRLYGVAACVETKDGPTSHYSLLAVFAAKKDANEYASRWSNLRVIPVKIGNGAFYWDR